MSRQGTLYIVSTPIGNVEDMTYRAVRLLQESDYIAVEDSRRSGILFKYYHITPKHPLIIFNEYNENNRYKQIISLLEQDMSVALVSDAGTPLLSDPGFPLVRNAVEQEIPVVSVPGPSSMLAAASISGLPLHRFQFLGFLSKKKARLNRELKEIENYDGTTIAFESPHRIMKTLDRAATIIPDFRLVLCRELTKKFEEIFRGKTKEVADKVRERGKLKGEIILLFAPGNNG